MRATGRCHHTGLRNHHGGDDKVPNRIIRESILKSRAINQLSPEAEVFYRRLQSVVDDYGRYPADHDILRACLYPLQLDLYSADKCGQLLSTVSKTRTSDGQTLVTVYADQDGRKFLQINNFGQRMRSDSKYPAPPLRTSADKCGQMTADARLVGDVVVVGDVVGDEVKALSPDGDFPLAEPEPPKPKKCEYHPIFEEIWTGFWNDLGKKRLAWNAFTRAVPLVMAHECLSWHDAACWLREQAKVHHRWVTEGTAPFGWVGMHCSTYLNAPDYWGRANPPPVNAANGHRPPTQTERIVAQLLEREREQSNAGSETGD